MKKNWYITDSTLTGCMIYAELGYVKIQLTKGRERIGRNMDTFKYKDKEIGIIILDSQDFKEASKKQGIEILTEKEIDFSDYYNSFGRCGYEYTYISPDKDKVFVYEFINCSPGGNVTYVFSSPEEINEPVEMFNEAFYHLRFFRKRKPEYYPLDLVKENFGEDKIELYYLDKIDKKDYFVGNNGCFYNSDYKKIDGITFDNSAFTSGKFYDFSITNESEFYKKLCKELTEFINK